MYTHKIMDILEEALNDEDIDMVICLLRENPTYIHHELTDGSTCKDKLLQLNEYKYVWYSNPCFFSRFICLLNASCNIVYRLVLLVVQLRV